MFARASRKLGLERAVLGTRDFHASRDGDDESKVSATEMEQLLRQGAYALVDADHDKEIQAFYENDIDTILNERARLRVVEGQKTADWLNKADELSKVILRTFSCSGAAGLGPTWPLVPPGSDGDGD